MSESNGTTTAAATTTNAAACTGGGLQNVNFPADFSFTRRYKPGDNDTRDKAYNDLRKALNLDIDKACSGGCAGAAEYCWPVNIVNHTAVGLNCVDRYFPESDEMEIKVEAKDGAVTGKIEFHCGCKSGVGDPNSEVTTTWSPTSTMPPIS